MSKFAVVGSRNIQDYQMVKEILDNYDISLIISGGAKGIDTLSEQYANDNNIPTKIHYAEWEKFGKSAGMIRNEYIINDADKIIAIWDGFSKGTKNSINHAKRLKKPLFLYTLGLSGLKLTTYIPNGKVDLDEFFS